MVFLDVVYNHFGPDGNYLHRYAPQFFTDRHHTPWGAAINFDDQSSRTVRDFVIHNALYWLSEYHLDGLRLDAVHAIIDESKPDILEELADAVRGGLGAQRHIHLVLENDLNQARYLGRDAKSKPKAYAAQWNDDIHHVLHVLATREQGGYYADYAARPIEQLGRCLAEGFAYQGDPSAYRDGELRGEPSAHLPPTAFVNFLQNHDQIGNRAFGDRISKLSKPEVLVSLTAILLLSPSIPLLFMGQEWGSEQPFPFFCDFAAELAEKVTEGRRGEFARFPEFSDPAARERIPDPNAKETFSVAVLDWEQTQRKPYDHWLALHRRLLALRRAEIVPRLAGMAGSSASYRILGHHALVVHWRMGDGSQLTLLANLSDQATTVSELPPGRVLFMAPEATRTIAIGDALPPWSVVWSLENAAAQPAKSGQSI
jgi:malto-oligosyltrehalose trehalohydrolase